MIIDECAEIVKVFKKSFENKYPLTDDTPNALEVWTLDDVLRYLDAELVLEFININPR